MAENKTVSLAAGEFKALALLNVAQLHKFMESLSVPTDQQLAEIDQHFDRTRVFMRSWKVIGDQQAQQQAEPAQVNVQEHAAGNGAMPVKRKGGWPAGKPRKQRAGNSAVAQ